MASLIPDDLARVLPSFAEAAVAFALTLALVLFAHWLATRAALAVSRRRLGVETELVTCTVTPVRALLTVGLALSFLPGFDLPDDAMEVVRRLLALAMAGVIGWTAIRLLGAARAVIERRSDISVADNLRARRRRTRVTILYRIAVILVGVATVCLMLMTIPSVRNVGLTLFASAGILGLAVAAAAQPALKNLIAGIQLAFTEPVRIDDVVIMEGEWGRVEQIRLTYVVIRVWDDRRLIVPVSKVLEGSFQNWTRESSELIGSVFFHVDPTVDVPPIRARFLELARESKLWDRRVAVLQVTEVRPEAVELRALVSARNASEAFDLRCEIRERLLAFIRDSQPAALPRRRTELVPADEAPRVSPPPPPSSSARPAVPLRAR